MKITDIRVDGFGVWNSISVDELPPGITLFYGPNEAGKTTLMQFIRAVLYGFSEERRQIYLPPVFGGVTGGMLRVENHTGGFVIERRESDKDPDGDGRIVVLADNGSRQGQHLLNVIVSGIDESIFNNVFAVGIRELQELATLNDTQAAEQLYNIASGVDRVSLVEVIRHLESSQNAIWNPEQGGELVQLREQRDRLRAQIDELQRQTRRWADLAKQRQGLVLELAEFDQRIEETEHEAKTVEIALQVRDHWLMRRQVDEQLEEIGHPDPLPEGCVERLDQLNQKIAEQRETLAPQKKRRRALRRELASQPINRALWDQSCRIEAICEHGPWIASLDDEIKQLNESVERAEVELVSHEESLTGEAAMASSAAVSRQVLQQLNPAAQALREAQRKRSIAKKVQKKSRQEVDDATADLETQLEGRQVENFEDMLEQTAERVKALRRRGQIEERLGAMRRERAELDEDYQEVLDDQFQDVRIMAGIGGIFVFGFVLLLTGIFGWKIMPMTAEICWGVSILGVICIGLAVFWKMAVERSGEDEIEECMERRERIGDEIASVERERDELDEMLPTAQGTFATRLAAAEKELKELEEMAPLQLEREQAKKRRANSGRHASGVDDELREARRRWRRGLREAGLPETLSPKHVRQLASHHQKKTKIERTLAEQRERVQRLDADRSALVERLGLLTEEVGLNAAGRDPQIQLSQLGTALAGQREMMTQRREWQREDKQLRRELSRGLKRRRQYGRLRESLFADARVADEEELRARAELIDRRSELERQHSELTRQIQTFLGEHCREEEIETEIGEFTADELERRGRTLRTTLQEHQAHLAQLHQRHGETKQEMKNLAEDNRLAAARFQLGCVETRITQVTKQWRTLAATLRLLEDIRESYEVERQPETLSEASLYLEKLTAGRYTRIWTPLGKNVLRIDDADGQAMPLEVLSRGTREAVFLSLRLALVAAYGRRGVNMPMILDDVLVNLDYVRAEAAVDVLCDFAREGRQLLFFTCHQHIKELFVAACVDTRVLPSHRAPGVHVVPLIEQAPPPEVEEEEEEEEEIEAIVEEEIVEEVEEEEEEPEIEEVVIEVPEEPVAEYEIELIAEVPHVEEIVFEAIEPEPAEPEPVVENELADPEPFEDGYWWWDTRRNERQEAARL